MRNLKLSWVIFVLLGCAALGLTVAKSFDEKLAYAVGTHTAIQKATAQSLSSHSITSAEAESVLKLADESRLVLNAARAAELAGDTTAANAKLLMATSILTSLQSYLNARSQK